MLFGVAPRAGTTNKAMVLDARPKGGQWHGIRPEVRRGCARSSYDEGGRCCRSVLPETEWCGSPHASLLGTTQFVDSYPPPPGGNRGPQRPTANNKESRKQHFTDSAIEKRADRDHGY